jgi:cholera toxin transcriptional activator
MAGRIFRFGIFELDDNTGEVRKDGRVEPRLREQSLQILLSLLERPQEVVTRDELRQRLWPSDTFVDFDHGLNTAVNQLRMALGDSAASPRFIQTLPRRGYRFIAPVEVLAPAPVVLDGAGFSGSTGTVEKIGGASEMPSLFSDVRELPDTSRGLVRILFGLIQFMYLSFYVLTLGKLADVERVLSITGLAARFIWVAIIVTAAAGIPVRLYLIAAVSFNYEGLTRKFLKLFPLIFPLDELWALAPFLISEKIGVGLAMAATAALLYLPFAQRSLLLMGSKAAK